MRVRDLTLFGASLMILLGACNRSEEHMPSGWDAEEKGAIKKFYGSTHPLGGGIVRAWTKFDGNTPVEVGVDITNNALMDLPHDHVMLSLPFHPVKNSGTFTHMLFDWAPHGHEPEFYEVPHFDIHFYAQSEAERMAIGPVDPQHDIYPDPIYLPEQHIPGGGVPQMGNHWIYLLSPELNGQPFTSTFIYGSYDGKVTFYEPMITKDWLMEQTNTVMAIPQPQAVQEDGYYPTEYRVTRTLNPDTYTIAMPLSYRSAE